MIAIRPSRLPNSPAYFRRDCARPGLRGPVFLDSFDGNDGRECVSADPIPVFEPHASSSCEVVRDVTPIHGIVTGVSEHEVDAAVDVLSRADFCVPILRYLLIGNEREMRSCGFCGRGEFLVDRSKRNRAAHGDFEIRTVVDGQSVRSRDGKFVAEETGYLRIDIDRQFSKLVKRRIDGHRQMAAIR